MLQAICCGYLGSDAEVKNANGKEFTTFRIAHTSKWESENGAKHEETTWVDCVLNGQPAVVPYLKRGQLVMVMGAMSLRVYSSAKDKCMKAGLTVNVRTIELLGGKTDEIPATLYNAHDGSQVGVVKYYNAPSLMRGEDESEFVPLVSRNQDRFVCDRNGWIQPYKEEGALAE